MARALSLKEEVDQESLLCPLWVKSGHKTTQLGMSALPPKADINLRCPECQLIANSGHLECCLNGISIGD